MKNVIFLFFCFAMFMFSPPAKAQFLDDGVLKGTLDLDGAVLQVNDVISGEGTITNGIIQPFSMYKKVFSENINFKNCIFEVGGKNVFSSSWYGNDFGIQKAINIAIDNNVPTLFIAESYKTNTPLYIYGSEQKIPNIKLYSDIGTTITYTGEYGAALNLGRVNCTIEGLKLLGSDKDKFDIKAISVDAKDDDVTTSLAIHNVIVDNFTYGLYVSPHTRGLISLDGFKTENVNFSVVSPFLITEK